MIAETSSGRAFGGLVRYLLHGRSGVEDSRVAWTMQRNLALHDPERAAVLMRATAAQNHRVEQPVYHLIVAFDPSDRPSLAKVHQVVDRLLDELRLKEHQMLIVAHRDRAHPHLHIVVNRVHPETGRAWDRWHDHTALERTLRTLERELGLREVDGHLHQLPGQRAPERRQHDQQRREQPEVPRDLDPEQFARINEAKRRIHDTDLLRHLDRLDFQTLRMADRDNALRDRLARATREVHKTTRVLYDAFESVYARPLEAWERFDDVVYSQGPGAAIRRLRHDPESYVEFRPYARPALLGLWHKTDDRAARELLPHAIAAARDYGAAITELRTVTRQIDPYARAADRDLGVRAEAELAAHSQRIERELARIRSVREQLPSQDVLQRRARECARALRPNALDYLRRSVGFAATTLAIVVQNRTVRDIAMGRELSL